MMLCVKGNKKHFDNKKKTMSRKQSRCSVFGYKTEHKSLHFLPASEPLWTQWITLIFQGNVPQNLPKYIYVCANHFTPDSFVNVMLL